MLLDSENKILILSLKLMLISRKDRTFIFNGNSLSTNKFSKNNTPVSKKCTFGRTSISDS